MERRISPNESPATLPSLSVVISCYFEEKSIDEFYSRLAKTLKSCGWTYEMIFVNDGSTDATFTKLKEIFSKDPSVSTIINLFKNSGQTAGITAGISEAAGRYVVLIDSDLQLDPEQLPELLVEAESGADVVTGYRALRHDSAYRKLVSKIGNFIMRRVSRANLRDFGCTFKIYRAGLLRGLHYGPNKIFQTVEVIGHAQTVREVPVNHHPRRYGTSGWTFWRLFELNLENLLYAPGRPFQVIMLLTVVLGLLLGIRVSLSFVLDFSILTTITNGLLLHAIIVALLAQVSILSLVGELVIRSFQRLQGSPRYIVREMYRRNADGTVSVTSS